MTGTETVAGVGTVGERAHAALAELSVLVDELSGAEAATEAVLATGRVYFTGTGRSGLMARAVAMRLMHTGLDAFVVGEIATPAIAAGDLLVAFSATGGGAVAAQAAKAAKLGARVLAVTAAADGALARAADDVLLVPARTSVATAQHAGSLFEQGCLVVGDALCAVVRQRLDVPESALDARHANLP